MAKKPVDLRKAFNELLRPKLERALKDDASGETPLRPAQRRVAEQMLAVGEHLNAPVIKRR